MIEAATRAQEHGWRSERPPLREWQAGRPVAATREEFLAHLDGLTVGRPASEGVFQDDRFLHPDLGFTVQFPSGWRTMNLNDQVVAIAPKRDAVVLLQLDSRGDDPREAALAYAMREGLHLGDDISLRVGGLPAFRARSLVPTSFGRIPAEITWIAYDGMVYRLLAGMQPGTIRSYEGIFRKYSHSFRSLTPEERASVGELRLRLARVHPGETMAELSTRTHNEWELAYTAVANGLAPAAPLPPGGMIKVAVREPYVPAPREAPGPPPPPPVGPAPAPPPEARTRGR
jgi:predicted Zn-dependent protease